MTNPLKRFAGVLQRVFSCAEHMKGVAPMTTANMVQQYHFKDHQQTACRPLIDEYITKRVQYWARCLAMRFRMQDDRRDDLEQDLTLEILKASKRYDSRSSSWHTFACRVLHVAAKRISQQEIRRINLENKPVKERLNVSTGHRSIINHLEIDDCDDIGQAELRMDVEVILEQMPEQLQTLAKLLMTHTPQEAAEEMGIHANSVYRMLDQIRDHFEMHDFQNFL